MQITFFTRKFRNGQRYLHCDVVHITTSVSGLAKKVAGQQGLQLQQVVGLDEKL